MYKMAEHSDLNKLLQNLNNVEMIKDARFIRTNIYEILKLVNDGFDVTPSLPTLVKLLAIGDTFVKRVSGEIITVLSEKNSEMVMLAINTLVQDCRDVNPIIRSLGLKLLGSLQPKLAADMFSNAVTQGLEDSSPYVRRQAALAAISLHEISPARVLEGGIWDTLYGHLSESDSATVASCLCSLEEIFASEKGIVISHKLGQYLISKLYSFTPCVQRYVLQFLLKYSPKSKSLVFEHLNALDSSLTDSSSLAVSLCALQLFCHLTSDLPKVQMKAYMTGWNAIKLYLTRERNEEIVTSIIDYLYRTNFPVDAIAHDFSKFFCRDDDAQFLLHQKIKILCRLITPENTESILEEFLLIARRTEKDLMTKMICYLTETIASKPQLEKNYALFIIRLIQLGVTGIFDCLIQVLAKVSFNDQDNWLVLAPCINEHYKEVESTSGKVALLEIIRSQGKHLTDATDILEHFLDQLEHEHDSSNLQFCRDDQHNQLKISLLGAMVTLCLQKPAKVQPLLSRLMEACINDQNRSVRDRALFLYGFLQSKVQSMQHLPLPCS